MERIPWASSNLVILENWASLREEVNEEEIRTRWDCSVGSNREEEKCGALMGYVPSSLVYLTTWSSLSGTV